MSKPSKASPGELRGVAFNAPRDSNAASHASSADDEVSSPLGGLESRLYEMDRQISLFGYDVQDRFKKLRSLLRDIRRSSRAVSEVAKVERLRCLRATLGLWPG